MIREVGLHGRRIGPAMLAAISLAALVSAAEGSSGDSQPGAQASPGCAASPEASGSHSIIVGAVERRFLLRLSAGYEGTKPRAVVIAFHGFTQGAKGMEIMADFAADWPEAIVVYPEGLDRSLPTLVPGFEGSGWQLTAGELGDRDLAFFDSLRRWLLDHTCMNAAQLYVAGYSNGAYFAHLLGCMRPEEVAAVAAAAGGIRCEPKKPVPVLLSHGKVDETVRFGEGAEADRVWRARNGCGTEASEDRLGCQIRRGCARAEVAFCAHAGNHRYDPSFTREATKFFQRQSR